MDIATYRLSRPRGGFSESTVPYMGVELGLGAYVCITLCIALFQCKASELHNERKQLLRKSQKLLQC